MMPDTPVNAGHAYASRAEDYEELEDWAKAAEAHSQAADQFQKAIEYTQDSVAGKTLRMLALDHLRKAKELERKLIKQNNKHQMQQRKDSKTTAHRPSTSSSHSSLSDYHQHPSYASSTTISSSFDMGGLRQALANDRRRQGGRTTHGSGTPAIGGSYAVLPLDGPDEDSDEDADSFNKFWSVVEQLMDKLSNPVAFASAPLNENDHPTPAWTQQATAAAVANEHVGQDHGQDDDHLASRMMESYFFVPDPQQQKPGPTASVESHNYAEENEQLKKRVEELSRQVQSLEQAAKERNVLKSSIIQFRNDVQKQAKRIMQNQDYSSMRASSSAALMTTSSNSHSGCMRPGGNIVTRTRELEEENRQLKIQNEKQQALMNKYRERWEKLKESAKKRRAQPDQESPPSSTNGSTYTTCSSDNMRPPTLLRSLAQQSSPFADLSRRSPPLTARESIGN